MLKEIYHDAESRMNKTLDSLSRELSGIRTGKATTNILDAIKVDYYGTPTPLKQVASVSAPDPKLLIVQPWEKNMVPEVIKSIQKADLGLNPISEGGHHPPANSAAQRRTPS